MEIDRRISPKDAVTFSLNLDFVEVGHNVFSVNQFNALGIRFQNVSTGVEGVLTAEEYMRLKPEQRAFLNSMLNASFLIVDRKSIEEELDKSNPQI